MDNELKLCPFCGKTPDYRGTDAHADDCYLVVVKRSTSPNDINEAWEERPIEDALRAEVARLTLDLKGSENVNAYLNKQNIDIAKEIGELRAEVARLQAELTHALDNIEDYKAVQDWARTDYEKLQAELQHDIWHQVEECMPNTEEMVLVVDVDIVRRGFWQYHSMDIEWRTADNRLIEVYWWKTLPKLPWEDEK